MRQLELSGAGDSAEDISRRHFNNYIQAGGWYRKTYGRQSNAPNDPEASTAQTSLNNSLNLNN